MTLADVVGWALVVVLVVAGLVAAGAVPWWTRRTLDDARRELERQRADRRG